MRINNNIIRVVLVTALFISAGCVKVQPWQRGNLAKQHMLFDTDPTEGKFLQHMYDSREGAAGGYGVGGGGCGCG